MSCTLKTHAHSTEIYISAVDATCWQINQHTLDCAHMVNALIRSVIYRPFGVCRTSELFLIFAASLHISPPKTTLNQLQWYNSPGLHSTASVRHLGPFQSSGCKNFVPSECVSLQSCRSGHREDPGQLQPRQDNCAPHFGAGLIKRFLIIQQRQKAVTQFYYDLSRATAIHY